MIFTTVRFKENCEYRALYSKDQGADVKETVNIVMVMIHGILWIHKNKEPMERKL